MLKLNQSFYNHTIECQVINMGQDLNVIIQGGDIPHIGAVALGMPVVLPHNINKVSSSVSLLTVPGHKEDEVVLKCAKSLAKELNVTVVVTCGIHIKEITFNQIQELTDTIDMLMNEAIEKLKIK